MRSRNFTRRDFLDLVIKGGLAVGAGGLAFRFPDWLCRVLQSRPDTELAGQLDELIENAPEARFWISATSPKADCTVCHDADSLDGQVFYNHSEATVRCMLCAQECSIPEGERGLCHARINYRGTLRSLVYGHPVSIHVDPVEKKPFYHFLPGTAAYSLATAGCPLRCKFCQNWEISQMSPEDYVTPYMSPDSIVTSARKDSTPVIAFTYNEPTVFAEYLLDIAELAREKGIRCVLISCGYMNPDPLREMCGLLDAIKIDLKGFSEDFYRTVCGAELKPVLRSIRQVAESGTHLEIVNLVVPGLNDSEEILKELSKWVVGEVGPDVPVHFTRFHPDYKMLNLSPTPIASLERARDAALAEGLKYPFVGNVPGHSGNHTYCPKCSRIVVQRTGFFVQVVHISKGRCEYCGERISVVWS